MKYTLFLMAAILMLGLASCKPSADDVAKKILEGQELSEADYQTIFEYSDKTIDELSDSIEAHKGDKAAMMHAVMALAVKYPDTNVFNAKLSSVDPATLSDKEREGYEKTMAKIEKAQQLMAECLGAIKTVPSDNGASFSVSVGGAENDSVGAEDESSSLPEQPTEQPQESKLTPNP